MPGMKGRVLKGFRFSLQALADLFFTRNCLICGRELDSGEKYVCSECFEDMPLTYFWDYPLNAAMERLGVRPGEGGVPSSSSLRPVSAGGSVPFASGAGGVPSLSSPRPVSAGGSVPFASGEGDTGCRVYNAASLFFYRHESPWCELVRLFKYGRDEGLGLWAARLLGAYLAGGGLYSGVQAVVPVPLHPLKKWRRGFNQAEIIARGVAEGLAGAGVRNCENSGSGLNVRNGLAGGCCHTGADGQARNASLSGVAPLNVSKSGYRADAKPSQPHSIGIPPLCLGENSGNGPGIRSALPVVGENNGNGPGIRSALPVVGENSGNGPGGRGALPVAADLLRRRRYTSTQTRKSAAERRTGIAGAFSLNSRALARLKAAGVRHVLIVDDVMTTGATLSECIRLLSPHFTVSVATLGFVE